MTEPLKNGAPTMQRAALLDSLKALQFSQKRFSKILKDGEYANGYQEGFEDALKAMSLIIGAEEKE